MERAVSLSSGNSDYITELGFQLLLQGKVKDAMRCYKNAMKIDETSVSALTGIPSHLEIFPPQYMSEQNWICIIDHDIMKK
jgi:hypothetical protein